MKNNRSTWRIIFGLLIAQILCLFVPQTVFSQTEKLGIVSYTAPKGFTKTTKENIVAFTQVNQATGGFCIITLYGATPDTGDPKSDFKREWNNLVIKPLNAETNPKTDTQLADGWTVISGVAAVDFQGGKSVAMLSVLSGGGKTISLLGVFNETSYMTQLTAFSSSMDVEKAVAEAPAPQSEVSLTPKIENGHLVIPMPTRQLTVADLVGEWGQNDGINTRYVDRYSGTYAGFESLHFTNKMTITAQGGYYNDFFAIQNGKKIKEDTNGTVAITGRVLSIKERNTKKYVIRGWLELPDMTILEVCGPWYDDDVIPEAIFSDPNQGANLDKKWVRKK